MHKYYNDDFVTQHDVLRELALHQSSQELIGQRQRLIMNISENDLPRWWREQKHQLINACLLSISTGMHIFSQTKTQMQIHYVNNKVLIACHTVYNSFCRWIVLLELVQHSSSQSWGFSSEFSDRELHLTWICG